MKTNIYKSLLVNLGITILVTWFIVFDSGLTRTIGDIYPVVDELVVTSAEPTIAFGIKATKISGYAYKNVDEKYCQFQEVHWFLKSGSTVKATFAEKARPNDKGTIYWESLLVGVLPETLNTTHAEVEHSCLGFKVLTSFYSNRQPELQDVIENK